MNKPFSTACERNKDPLLKVLREVVSPINRKLLEIGSGTGQHAVYFAPHFKNLTWVTSDRRENHGAIQSWLQEFKIPNIQGPVSFEVGRDEFPRQKFDLVFSANTFHIMSWKHCKTLMKMFGTRLREGAQVILYGPFNYGGEFTSASNAEFDRGLKEKNPESGIRNAEDVIRNMDKNGFSLYKDYEMPANNRTLVFTRLEYIKAKEPRPRKST